MGRFGNLTGLQAAFTPAIRLHGNTGLPRACLQALADSQKQSQFYLTKALTKILLNQF